MGMCFSSPEDKYASGHKKASGSSRGHSREPSQHRGSVSKDRSVQGAARKTPPAPLPDFGLSATHEVVKLLGRGGEGETWLFREKGSGALTAIKLIKRPIPKPAIAIIKREIKIQADLGQGHLNIVSADEVVLTRSHLGLVMEYVPGGNMVGYVTKLRETRASRGGLCLDEDEARYYFIQLLSAVEYCHAHKVAHRDLKLDNTLLDGRSPPWLKLCDFGFAKHWQMSSNMDTMRIGTPEYMGPELISSRTGYDGKKVDVWAAGVLLFVMLAGMFPFETSDDNFNNTAGLYDIWLQQIKTCWRDLPNNGVAVLRLSPELKDLLDRMFDVKQDSRIDIASIKAHAWYQLALPPHYASSLEELHLNQAAIDEQVRLAGGHNTEHRDKKLEEILDKASTPGAPDEPTTRLDLSTFKKPSPEDIKRQSMTPRVEHALLSPGMGPLPEHEPIA